MGLFITFKRFAISTITAVMLMMSPAPFAIQTIVPVTGTILNENIRPGAVNLLSLEDFTEAVMDGESGKIKGLYADETFMMRVIQQPAGKPGFVSPIEGVATQFGMAAGSNVTGMLAHNFSSGRFFFDLTMDNRVRVVYGDGSVMNYRVTGIHKFQALSPKSASSDFVNLDTGEKLSAAGLFSRMYTGKHHLTLQTCIQEGTEDSWGRLFVIAEPLEA